MTPHAAKLPIMEEWYRFVVLYKLRLYRWEKSHELLVRSGITKENIVQMSTESTLTFRKSFDDMFDLLRVENIPTLIFSAGLGDIIEQTFISKKGSNFLSSNVHIASNHMHFGDTGKIVGFKNQVYAPHRFISITFNTIGNSHA